MNVGRPRQACTPCRKRKIKCDKQAPCGQCCKRRSEAYCTVLGSGDDFDPSASPPPPEPTTGDSSARIAELEQTIRKLQRTIADQQAQSLPNPPVAGYPAEALPRDAEERHVVGGRETEEVDQLEAEEEHVARVLDTFAMGHRTSQNRLKGAIGNVAPQRWPKLIQQVRKALSILPDTERSWELVSFYFEAMLSTPQEQLPYVVAPCWLCLHMMVLCLATHLLEPMEREKMGMPMDQWQEIARALFIAAKEMLFASDFLFSHTLEHLQCIILMGVYQYNTDLAADSHWSLLGSAIKIAQSLGLQRLGSEDQPSTAWPAAWRDPARRDVGRRIWWNLVYLDWSFAPSYGWTYCIHPSQNLAALPSNINDIEVENEGRLIEQVLEASIPGLTQSLAYI
ncbi:hypothetical protein IAT38_008360 [Cryptococcus sp. DSM 104549]